MTLRTCKLLETKCLDQTAKEKGTEREGEPREGSCITRSAVGAEDHPRLKEGASMKQWPKKGSGQNDDFPLPSVPLVRSGAPATLNLKEIGKEAAAAAEKRVMQRMLEATHWNRKMTAQALRISYKALLYKIQKYGLNELESFPEWKEEV